MDGIKQMGPSFVEAQAEDATPRSRAGSSTRMKSLRGSAMDGSLVLVLCALVTLVGIREPSFLAGQNVLNLVQQWAPLGIMAVAGTFVVIAGGADFSVGGTYLLCGVTFAAVANHEPIWVAAVSSLLVGSLVGLANGLIVTKAHVNSFICTLGVGQVGVGLGLVITNGAPVSVDKSGFDLLGSGLTGGIALSSMMFVAIILFGGFVLSSTIYGRTIYAVGGNAEASRLSGIRVDRILISTYVVSGLAAALAGMIITSRLGSGQATSGYDVGFDVFTAVVLGGSAIGGGSGAMWRTAIGIALLATMQNGFDSLGINSFYQTLIKGMILVGAVSWDQYVQRHRAHQRG